MQFHFGVLQPPEAPELAIAGGQKPFFGDHWALRKDERDEAILTGKLPPGAGELRPRATEYSLASWLSLASL